MNIIKSIFLGFKRHYWRFIASVFVGYSVIWTLVESIAHYYPSIKMEGLYFHLTSILISIIIGLYRIKQPNKISFKINTSDTTLNIYYGDVFEQKGHIAISVNEYFDSELGDLVSENTLHGVVIKRFFGGHKEAFDKVVDNDLAKENFIKITREHGKNKQYPIGTTTKIYANEHKFLLFVLSHTDLDTLKAHSDMSTMVQSMKGLFTKARNSLNGEPLILPLIGSGISGVGLPATQLVQLIVLAIIEETKLKQITKQIDLVLHESRFQEVDLEYIQKQWS